MPKLNWLKTFVLISLEESAEEFDIKVLSCNFAKNPQTRVLDYDSKKLDCLIFDVVYD